MEILVLSDIHGDLELISYVKDDLKRADIVLLSGDITHFGKIIQIKRVISHIKKFNVNILAVPGNCDYPDVGKYLAEEELSLDCRYKKIKGVYFMGVGGSLPCPGKTPTEYSEEEYLMMLEETVMENLTEGLPIILLNHQPPFNTIADKLGNGFHVGSHSIRQFIEKYQPVFSFCGHIHESICTDFIGKTIVVNPGPFKLGRLAKASFKNNKANAEIINMFTR